MVVDLIRSCYTVPMCFRDGDPAVPVKWFFTAPEAKYFPGLNSFYSRNWEDESEKFDEIGEQPGNRRWNNGQRPALATGQHLCDDPLLFRFGLAPGQLLDRPVFAGPVPVCCIVPTAAGSGGEGISFDGAVEWTSAGGAVADGSEEWERGEDVPSLYLETFIYPSVPGVTDSGSFTLQSWTTRLRVRCFGPGAGGGGGEGSFTLTGAGGGGSAGGEHVGRWYPVVGGSVYAWQVGGYGDGGAAGPNDGEDGTDDTYFIGDGPLTITGHKGLGGKGGPGVPVLTITVPTPGGEAPSFGDPGHPGLVFPAGSGNGALGGAGGSSINGGGGSYQFAAADGFDASEKSGSGGGGACALSTDRAGGKGSDGFIWVEEWNF